MNQRQQETDARMPMVTLVVAMDEAGLIGADGGMPWHLPADLRWFKQQTLGKPILMGRRTYQAIGRALPKRRNLVLTRAPDFGAADVEPVASLDGALDAVRTAGADELMVIGGAQVYALALPRADRLIVTRIQARYAGDTHFPAIDWSHWQLIDEWQLAAANQEPAARFTTWERRHGQGHN